VSILADTRLTEGFMTKPDIQYVDGHRLYGEMNTGHCWEGAQRKAPRVIQQNILFFIVFLIDFFGLSQGAIALLINIYLDGTWLSKGGGHSATPISMTIGNLPRRVMNKSFAKRVECGAG
jgi:hypothetical protein